MKTIKQIGLMVMTLLLLSLPLQAQNRVKEIEVEAVLYPDGSMYVTQVGARIFT